MEIIYDVYWCYKETRYNNPNWDGKSKEQNILFIYGEPVKSFTKRPFKNTQDSFEFARQLERLENAGFFCIPREIETSWNNGVLEDFIKEWRC